MLTAYWRRLTQMRPEQALLVFQSSLAAVAIAPFGFWRLARGDWGQGVFDLGLVLVLLALAYLSRQTQWLRPIAFGVALLYVLASLFVAYQFGPLGHYWFFPAIVAGYFVVRAQEALWLATLGLLAHLALAWARQGWGTELATFAATSLLDCVFNYAFASRLRRDNRRLYLDSTIDSLTGVGNRRLLDDVLAELSSEESLRPPALLMLDIDHFKDINDRYGHPVGDLVLSRLGQVLATSVSPGQQVFRYGGEEFVVLVPAGDGEAAALAERLRLAVERSQLIREAPITISIGVAQRQAGESVHAWMRRADDAMYQAKQQGRNRSCVAAV